MELNRKSKLSSLKYELPEIKLTARNHECVHQNDYEANSSCKAREAVWSNWAVKCSQVNRDFSSKYDIVCQDYELLLRSLRSLRSNYEYLLLFITGVVPKTCRRFAGRIGVGNNFWLSVAEMKIIKGERQLTTQTVAGKIGYQAGLTCLQIHFG